MTCCFQSMSFVDYVLNYVVQNRAVIFGKDSLYVRFECDDGAHFDWSNGWNSSALFGQIVYRKTNENVERKSKPLVIKLMPPRSLYKESLILHFVNELFFYSRILPYFRTFRPSVDHLFAKFIDGMTHYNVDIAETALIFENLQSNGYKSTRTDSWYLDYDHASLVLRKLGQFHGYSFVAKAKEPRQFHFLARILHTPNFALTTKFNHIWANFVWRGVRPLQSEAKYCNRLDKVLQLLNSLHESIDQTLKPNLTDPLAVLCHGDFLHTNMLFQYEGERVNDLKILDLASSVLAPPGLDLAYVLYFQTDHKMRQERWDDLVYEYYSGVKEACEPDVEPPDREAIVDTMKLTWFYVYTVISYFLPEMLARRRGTERLFDVIPNNCHQRTLDEFPDEVWSLARNIGGAEATEALVDILKDVIDRGFA